MIPCLYCNSENSEQQQSCSHCGMELPDKHPHGAKYRRGKFKWGFWFTVIFCVVMIYYLPR